MASMVDVARLGHYEFRLAPRDLTLRQTDTSNCPDDGDCTCTSWGADCDVADWSWFTCDKLPEACASSTAPAPTSTAPPQAPATPTAGPIQCAPGNEQTYKSCWHDVHADSVKSCASALANQFTPGNKMTSSSANVTQVLREGASGGQGGNGVTYMMNIGWIPGCTDYQSITIDNPMGVSGDNTRNYNDLIVGTYNFCNGNSGLGGYVDVGCLRYGFYPNDIDGVFASPPHPEKFWAVYPNICG
ncbi:MAG: hypothetical protein OHK93_003533 [Ramalina farinacea]|uniref:Uncharacterized protein n=1 Tax=Ramalina farinacea TaxID=258253 RepID=A0AA43QXX4_9LECA|nr:hypothetical protein [Ramalina farinacea]